MGPVSAMHGVGMLSIGYHLKALLMDGARPASLFSQSSGKGSVYDNAEDVHEPEHTGEAYQMENFFMRRRTVARTTSQQCADHKKNVPAGSSSR